MKIFEMQVGGEKDWVTSEDMLKAIQYYVSTTDCSLHEIDDCLEINESEWDSMKIRNTDYTGDEDDCQYETFRQAIERLNGSSDILASTAY